MFGLVLVMSSSWAPQNETVSGSGRHSIMPLWKDVEMETE